VVGRKTDGAEGDKIEEEDKVKKKKRTLHKRGLKKMIL